MQEKTRVLLVDDQPMVRLGLRHVVAAQENMDVAGEAGSLTEALEVFKAVKPQVAILDISLEGGRGQEFIQAARKLVPDLKVLVFTLKEEARYLRQVLSAGASGYVLKKAGEPELVLALQAVVRGDHYIDPAMTRDLLSGVMGGKEGGGKDNYDLSGRQKEILRMVALGYTDKQIAEKMFISIKTVESNKARIKEKLNITQRAELVQYALDHYF